MTRDLKALIKERDALRELYENLEGFLITGVAKDGDMPTLSEIEYDILHKQLKAMLAYLSALNQRIGYYTTMPKAEGEE